MEGMKRRTMLARTRIKLPQAVHLPGHQP